VRRFRFCNFLGPGSWPAPPLAPPRARPEHAPKHVPNAPRIRRRTRPEHAPNMSRTRPGSGAERAPNTSRTCPESAPDPAPNAPRTRPEHAPDASPTPARTPPEHRPNTSRTRPELVPTKSLLMLDTLEGGGEESEPPEHSPPCLPLDPRRSSPPGEYGLAAANAPGGHSVIPLSAHPVFAGKYSKKYSKMVVLRESYRHAAPACLCDYESGRYAAPAYRCDSSDFAK
jgi:hypothetical protein